VNIDLIAPQSLKSFKLKSRYQTLFNKTLRYLKQPMNQTVDVFITNNQKIQQLNAMFRQKDYPTDVLSFPSGEPMIIQKKQPIHLGQIVISYPKAKQQAKAFHHSLERELSFLFVHGLLHLLGYNHDTVDQEKKMLHLQDVILGKRMIHE
jgi:probable rRNA maturation factor